MLELPLHIACMAFVCLPGAAPANMLAHPDITHNAPLLGHIHIQQRLIRLSCAQMACLRSILILGVIFLPELTDATLTSFFCFSCSSCLFCLGYAQASGHLCITVEDFHILLTCQGVCRRATWHACLVAFWPCNLWPLAPQ